MIDLESKSSFMIGYHSEATRALINHPNNSIARYVEAPPKRYGTF